MKICPTCGNKHILFIDILENGNKYIMWNCGHQRGGGRPL